jgi:hypothetical protein
MEGVAQRRFAGTSRGPRLFVAAFSGPPSGHARVNRAQRQSGSAPPPPPQPLRDAGDAVAAAAGPPPRHDRQPFRPYSVLPLVSSAVESAAEMATFEAFAGRSAMVRRPLMRCRCVEPRPHPVVTPFAARCAAARSITCLWPSYPG